jgi:predicted nucleic-acid-binding Zn-ribbon protein
MVAGSIVVLEREVVKTTPQMRLYTKICKSCGYTEFYADTKELGA